MSKRTLLGFSVILAAMMPYLSAQALDKPGFCRDYATAAVNSARQNIRLRCGFAGSRYTLSWQQHFGWCMSVGRDFAAQERDVRRNQMMACRR